MPSEGSLEDQIVDRRPFESDGNSGNAIESVTLRDERILILKRVSPQRDWMARETHDDGRLVSLWERGLLARVPDVIDHAIVAVERDGEAWNVFMRDVSDSLIPRNARFDRAGVRRILNRPGHLRDPRPAASTHRATRVVPGVRRLALGRLEFGTRRGHSDALAPRRMDGRALVVGVNGRARTGCLVADVSASAKPRCASGCWSHAPRKEDVASYWPERDVDRAPFRSARLLCREGHAVPN
jgi:hypothetical protein